MKRNLLVFLVIGLGGAGCTEPFTGAFVFEKPALPEKTADSPPVTRKEKPITADQISEQNARDQASRLTLEMDRDEQGGLRIETEVEVPGGKK